MDDFHILSPGERLRDIRKRLNLRQDDLAMKNLSKNYISMFENGKRKINIISATYLSQKINSIAKNRKIDLNVSASYFVKSEKDIARDKCINCLNDLMKKSLCDYEIYLQTYNIIYFSKKYDMGDLLAEAYYLKGLQLYKNGLYNCAIAHYSQSLTKCMKSGYNERMGKIYLNMAKTYYMKECYSLALTYFNLAGLIEESEEIFYYKALSYYKMGKYELAKNINNKILFRNHYFIKLKNNITAALGNDDIKK